MDVKSECEAYVEETVDMMVREEIRRAIDKPPHVPREARGN